MSVPVALQVLSSARGGGAVHVRALTPGLRERGYAVEIALPEDGGHIGATDFETVGAQVVLLPQGVRGRVLGLVARLRRDRPAVVHAHGARAGLETALALLASGAKPVPLIVTVHGYTTPFRPPLRRALQGVAERWVARRASLLFAVCEAERYALAAVGLGDGGRLQLLRVGYPLADFDQIDDAQRLLCRDSLHDGKSEGPVFLTVCRLDDPRDLATLIEAFARVHPKLKDAVLWIVGDGPRRPAIERQIAELGAGGWVQLFGFRRDVPRLMAAADVFVLTTEAHEGLPIALLEAQAAGLPVIATNAGGIREAMRPEISGTLVPRRDAAALASALEQAGLDSQRRARMGAAGRDFARSYGDPDQMAAEVAAAYRSVCR